MVSNVTVTPMITAGVTLLLDILKGRWSSHWWSHTNHKHIKGYSFGYYI